MGSNLKQRPSPGSLRVVIPTLGKKWYSSLAICGEGEEMKRDLGQPWAGGGRSIYHHVGDVGSGEGERVHHQLSRRLGLLQ